MFKFTTKSVILDMDSLNTRVTMEKYNNTIDRLFNSYNTNKTMFSVTCLNMTSILSINILAGIVLLKSIHERL